MTTKHQVTGRDTTKRRDEVFEMSYCRWSTDDFQCDVYVYEAEDGYIIHVARNRITWLVPLPAHYTWQDGEFDFEKWYSRHRTVRDLMNDESTHVDVQIGLPYDGRTWVLTTAEETAERLEYLRGYGYRVPDFAIEELRDEAKERQSIGDPS